VHCIDDRDPPGMVGNTRLQVILNSKEKLSNNDDGLLDIDINVRPGL
jgi:hypothetical protein